MYGYRMTSIRWARALNEKRLLRAGAVAIAATLLHASVTGAAEVRMINEQHPDLVSSFTLDFGEFGGERSANISTTEFELEIDPAAATARFVRYLQHIDPLELPGGVSTGNIVVEIVESLGGAFDRSTGIFTTEDVYAIHFDGDLSPFGIESPFILPSTSSGTVTFDTFSKGATAMEWVGEGSLGSPYDEARSENVPFHYSCSVKTTFEANNLSTWVTTSQPPHGAIDARQPSTPEGAEISSWDSIVVHFAASPLAALTPADFVITRMTPAGDVLDGPDVRSIETVDPGMVRVTLEASLEPGMWTLFTHQASDTTACLGYLPGDVNGDGTASPAIDLTALVDCINHGGCEEWQADINRSGERPSALDLTRLIDLFNGAGAYRPWIGARLGPSPCSTR